MTTSFTTIGETERATGCAKCGKTILRTKGQSLRKKYCSNECSRLASLDRHRKNNPHRLLDLNASTAGAVSELIVSADLMKKGYAVFRSLSPSCTCDLVIMKDGGFQRVEVTTGYFNSDKEPRHAKNHKPANYDILAVVIGSSIFYEYNNL